jgi:hypothetical protein
MSWPKSYRVVSIAIISAFLCFPFALDGKEKKSSSSGQLVDSGTFGVYVNGKKVASEKFEVTQSPDFSTAKGELKLEDSKETQFADLQMTPTGNLIKYAWTEKDKGSLTVEPKDEFLIEKIQLVQPNKNAEQPFLMPVSTMVLDDYFFSHRQILLWRYLAMNCQKKPGETGCNLPKQQYGVIVPRQQVSAQITIEYAGNQKVAIKGVDHELSRFEMHMEGNDWTVWIDGAYKIQKIAIAADNAEVYRE